MEFTDVLALRCSARAYTEEAVAEEAVAAVLEAAQRSPVGHHNYAGYRLTAIENKEVLALMRKTFSELSGRQDDPSYGAPVFIIVSVTPEASEVVQKYDCACIIENMHLAATNLGLGSCYIHGMIRTIREEKAWQEAAGIAKEDVPMCGLILGHAKMAARKRPAKENMEVNFCK